jgi:hypothetical protein
MKLHFDCSQQTAGKIYLERIKEPPYTQSQSHTGMKPAPAEAIQALQKIIVASGHEKLHLASCRS